MINDQKRPWLDSRLSKEAMNHLRNTMDTPASLPVYRSKNPLAGNISKSSYVQDKDNWFYKNVLKKCSEYLYLKQWDNYFNVTVVKSVPPPVFELETLWVNYQKQHEFNPPHKHTGDFSFVVFMKIPTHWKDQHALPFSANSNMPCASDFQFLLGQGQGPMVGTSIPLSPQDEGRMLFFPAWLSHQVFPFYGTEEERITISGNIMLQEDDEKLQERLERTEKRIEEMEGQCKIIKGMLKYERENDETEKNSERS